MNTDYLYETSYYLNALSMVDFCAKYQQMEKFLAYCRECPNYKTVWSCPPFSFDVKEFLRPYHYIYVVGVRIDLAPETILKANTLEKMKSIGWDILLSVKLSLEDEMQWLEKHSYGSLSLSSGGCNRCHTCSRKDRKPCRQTGKMRYSLDAFGFDLTAITGDLLNIELQWCHDSLPKYFTLIHGLMTLKPVEANFWQNSRLKLMDLTKS